MQQSSLAGGGSSEDPHFTPEELAYYASLDLEDPSDDVLVRFAEEQATMTDIHSPPTAPSAPAPAVERPNLGSPPVRPVPSTDRYVKYILDKQDCVAGTEGVAEAILQATVVDLSGRSLTNPSSLTCFLNVKTLYLQHNALQSLDGFELLSQLRALHVCHNALTSLAPLQQLGELFFLDAGDNQLMQMDLVLQQLPCATLQYLNLQRNPCVPAVTDTVAYHRYQEQLTGICPLLTVLDEEPCNKEEEEEEEEEGSSAREDNSSSADSEAEVTELMDREETTPVAVRNPKSARRMQAFLKATTATQNDTGDLDRITSAAVSGIAAVLSQEDRLLQQFLQQSLARRASVPKSSGSHGNADVGSSIPSVVESSSCASPGGMASEEKAEAGMVAGASPSRLYNDLQYTHQVMQDRLQRSIDAHWDNVAKILQTQQSLNGERRRRQQERMQQPTEAYTAMLQQLQQEFPQADFAKYRERGSGMATSGKAPVSLASIPAPPKRSSYAAAAPKK